MSASVSKDGFSREQTMELLWSRIRQRGDLPGFSKVVGAIIGAMRGDDDREFNMTKTVLQDPALTQKVLRLANSAMYSVFGQGINTVSKAVIVLGTEAIGHLALGLKLIDGLTPASLASAAARTEMEKAVLAGHIARQLASSASARDVEEVVVSSMLHTLGRMMTTFYLPDRWELVQKHCKESGMSEEQAAYGVLGLKLDDIGRRAAQHWGLPAALIETLQDVAPKPAGEPLSHKDWVRAVSTLSSRCASALCGLDVAYADTIESLAESYASMLGIEAEQVVAAVDAAQHNAAQEHSVSMRPLRRGLDKAGSAADGHGLHTGKGKPADAAQLLTHGVADIRGAAQTASADQVIAMALETVYQGLGFSRAVAFLRDQDEGQYAARMCFGNGLQELLGQLHFDGAYQPDVFHAALANDKMVFVENALDSGFVGKMPRWWRDTLKSARGFMVLPLTVNRQPTGFIYGDWDLSQPASRLEQSEIGPLNELRRLVIQAIKRRRQ